MQTQRRRKSSLTHNNMFLENSANWAKGYSIVRTEDKKSTDKRPQILLMASLSILITATTKMNGLMFDGLISSVVGDISRYHIYIQFILLLSYGLKIIRR